MASIKRHYNIAGSVPFVNVDVMSDNLWFLDPCRIRLASTESRFRSDALRCLDSFFVRVTQAVASGGRDEREQARADLCVLNEPWETRMGMSRTGFHGHGAADDLGNLIWDGLDTDLRMFVDVGLLKHLEHLPIYISGIDRDITSDITTRIVFGPLADFTSAMLRQFPEFTAGGHRTKSVARQVWEPSSSAWVERTVELPVAGDKPLLLVPAQWAGRHLLMNGTRFYETSMLSYIQDSEAAVSSDGKLLKTPKDALKQRSSLARGVDTRIRVTHQAYGDGVDLLAAFTDFVKGRPIKSAGVAQG